jgi:hypothetical protein
MTENEAKIETKELLRKYRLNPVKPVSAEDYDEIKKWIRLAVILPKTGNRYLSDFKKFTERYYYFLTHETGILDELREEVLRELEIEPISEDEMKLTADVVIKHAMRAGI